MAAGARAHGPAVTEPPWPSRNHLQLRKDPRYPIPPAVRSIPRHIEQIEVREICHVFFPIELRVADPIGAPLPRVRSEAPGSKTPSPRRLDQATDFAELRPLVAR